jgi:lipopolysaccharide transport system ATP-binding protein
MRDGIANGAKGLLKPFQRGKSQGADPTREEFWALKDVSFEIRQGDRWGLLGRMGRGNRRC